MDAHDQAQVALAAAYFPVGSRVRYFPVKGERAYKDADVRSAPWMVGDQVVLKITGQAGCVCTSHLRLLTAD